MPNFLIFFFDLEDKILQIYVVSPFFSLLFREGNTLYYKPYWNPLYKK